MQTLLLLLCSAAITAVLPADFWWLDNNVFGGGEVIGPSNQGINTRNRSNQRNQRKNRRNKDHRNRSKSYGNNDVGNGDEGQNGANTIIKAQAQDQGPAASCSGAKCNKRPQPGGGGLDRQSQSNKGSGKCCNVSVLQAIYTVKRSI